MCMTQKARPMTIRQAREIVKNLGMSFRVIDGEEYRVNFIPDREVTASYHYDLEDAVNTAKAMYAQSNI